MLDTCEALLSRKRIPWPFTSFCDFKPLEYVQLTSASAHSSTQCSRGPPTCPGTESTSNDPRTDDHKSPMCKKRQFDRVIYHLLTGVFLQVQRGLDKNYRRAKGARPQPSTRADDTNNPGTLNELGRAGNSVVFTGSGRISQGSAGETASDFEK